MADVQLGFNTPSVGSTICHCALGRLDRTRALFQQRSCGRRHRFTVKCSRRSFKPPHSYKRIAILYPQYRCRKSLLTSLGLLASQGLTMNELGIALDQGSLAVEPIPGFCLFFSRRR
jgi:hypothetical protein